MNWLTMWCVSSYSRKGWGRAKFRSFSTKDTTNGYSEGTHTRLISAIQSGRRCRYNQIGIHKLNVVRYRRQTDRQAKGGWWTKVNHTLLYRNTKTRGMQGTNYQMKFLIILLHPPTLFRALIICPRYAIYALNDDKKKNIIKTRRLER